MDAIVYINIRIFFARRGIFGKLRNITRIFPNLSYGIFSLVTRFDQSCASESVFSGVFVCLIALHCLSTVWSEKRLLLATMYLKTHLHWLQDGGTLFLQLSTGTSRSIVNTSKTHAKDKDISLIIYSLLQDTLRDICSQALARELVKKWKHKHFDLECIVPNPNHKLYHFLPPKNSCSYNLRRQHQFVNPVMRTERFSSTFLTSMCRRKQIHIR